MDILQPKMLAKIELEEEHIFDLGYNSDGNGPPPSGKEELANTYREELLPTVEPRDDTNKNGNEDSKFLNIPE